MIDALGRIGKSRFGASWSGLEWFARTQCRIREDAQATNSYANLKSSVEKLEQRSPTFAGIAKLISQFMASDQVSAGKHFESEIEEDAAAIRAVAVWSEACSWFHSKKVVTIGTTVAGIPVDLPSSYWISTEAFRSVGNGTFELNACDPLSGQPITVWVHVEARSLEKALRPIREANRRQKTYSPAKLIAWYPAYVADCLANGRQPSRDDDVAAANKIFGEVPRAPVYKLRRDHAPANWLKPGRRPGRALKTDRHEKDN